MEIIRKTKHNIATANIIIKEFEKRKPFVLLHIAKWKNGDYVQVNYLTSKHQHADITLKSSEWNSTKKDVIKKSRKANK